jgi:hypothetical protein
MVCRRRRSPGGSRRRPLLGFARANNLTVVTSPPNRKFLHVRAAAAVINEVFHVKLQEYKHPTENRLFYSPATEPTVALDTSISHITGFDNLHVPGRHSNVYQERNPSGSPVHAGGPGTGGCFLVRTFGPRTRRVFR